MAGPAGGSSLAGPHWQAWVFGEADETLPSGDFCALLLKGLNYELEHHITINMGEFFIAKIFTHVGTCARTHTHIEVEESSKPICPVFIVCQYSATLSNPYYFLSYFRDN